MSPARGLRAWRWGAGIAIALACAPIALAAKKAEPEPIGGGGAIPVRHAVLPKSASQGARVHGVTHPAAIVEYAGRTLRVTPYGSFVFGIGRDAVGPAVLRIKQPASGWIEHRLDVVPRQWPVEHIRGVPPRTVDPPPEIAARIAREQAAVAAVRGRDDARSDFVADFIWPVQGRISGRFGSARSYNGKPGTPHSGTDVAAATGTPLRAPAAGLISFANADLYLTGGTLVLDHGHGVSSTFLHLSRIDVRVGQAVKQGDLLGEIGATGRATGPHMHWGLNWFEVRLDPQLLAPPMPAAATAPQRAVKAD